MNDAITEERKVWTGEERAVIRRVWVDEPPTSCTGKCDLKGGFMFSACTGCGWEDLGLGGPNP